jgi:hypothetical protein
VRRADNLTTFMRRLSTNLEASTSWDPKGLSRPVMGLLYLFTHVLNALSECNKTQRSSSINNIFMWLFTIFCIRQRAPILPDSYPVIVILIASSQHRPFLTSYFHPFAFLTSLLFTSPSETRNNSPSASAPYFLHISYVRRQNERCNSYRATMNLRATRKRTEGTGKTVLAP